MSNSTRATIGRPAGTPTRKHPPPAACTEDPPPYLRATTQPAEVRPPCVAEALAWLESRISRGPAMGTPAAVRDFLRLRYGAHDVEVFGALFLNAQHHLIECRELFHGTLTQTTVYPREILRPALDLNAASVVLFHNHPSGTPEPSQADQCLTQTLKNALALVDVRVVDHFVVAAAGAVSFAERGLL